MGKEAQKSCRRTAGHVVSSKLTKTRKAACVFSAMLTAVVGLTVENAGANHNAWYHWDTYRSRTVYIDVREGASFNTVLQAEWDWGNYALDLWAVRADTGTNYLDCRPARHRIVVCLDPYISEFARADWALYQDGHITSCVIKVSLDARWSYGAIAHELGHCLGLAHGGDGIMNNQGYISYHDIAQKEYNHGHADNQAH